MIRKYLLIGLAAALMATTLSTAPAAAEALVCPSGQMPFDDVSINSFAHDDIICISLLDITTGISATKYSPKDFVTREQMAAFISRLYKELNGSDAPVVPTPFVDMPSNFATDHIARIYGLGITKGTNPAGTTYSPRDFVTREQMASFLARLRRSLEGFCASPAIPFTDVPDSAFARLDVACIYGLDVTKGTNPAGTTYSPSDFVTREQMAAFIARMYRAGRRDAVFTPDVPDAPDAPEPPGPPGPSTCSLRTALVDVIEVVTSEHIAVWWGPDGGDLTALGTLVLSDMETAWIEATDELGLGLPPGAPTFCTNIYLIDTGGSTDVATAGFGTDANGVPFVNLPLSTAMDFLATPPGPDLASAYTTHEVMHIYHLGTPFALAGDSEWYQEATAEWFVDYVHPNNTAAMDTAGAFLVNPQLPLWTARHNQGVPQSALSYSRSFHDAGAQVFLSWLADEAGAAAAISASFRDAPAGALPQEWLFDNLGPGVMALEYVDFAAHAATLDFSPPLVADALLAHVADAVALSGGDDNFETATWVDNGTTATWQSPPAGLEPAAWAYNAIRVDVTTPGTFTVELDPATTGRAGTTSQLTGRVVVNRAGARNYSIALVNGLATVPVLDGDELWLVVASTPDLFTGSEVFDYEYRIYR